MITTALYIAPIFALLVIGYALRRGGIPSFEFWQLNDRLVYWVLMPSLLFYKTSTAQFDMSVVGAFATAVLGGFACAVAYGLVVWRFSALPAATASSVLQGAARHNTFIALAIAERIYGSEGLALATLASAMLIPTTNFSVVTLMAVMNAADVDASHSKKNIGTSVLRDLLRNPMLVSVLLGLLCNHLMSGQPVALLHDTTKLLGQAALPIMLLCVGASLRIREMSGATRSVLFSLLGKMLLFPCAAFLIAQVVGLNQLQTLVAVLFAAAPTGSASYTLARQMHGDAPAMATIIVIQTALSFLSIPITLMLVGNLLS